MKFNVSLKGAQTGSICCLQHQTTHLFLAVTCHWAWYPWHGESFGCIARNSFQFQGSPVIFHAANLRNLVFTRRCLAPERFSDRFDSDCKSNVRCMDIISRWIFQGCVYHVGVTGIIDSTFSQRTLFVTRPVRMEGGNAKANILFQSCCIASFSKLFGSDFNVIYWES